MGNNMANVGTPLVELKDISISFGGIKAVDRVSVDLYPGEVVGLQVKEVHVLAAVSRKENLGVETG